MAITAEETGEYLGYTQGDTNQAPTLYFENGRITQEHPNINNVGWHPNNHDNWYRGNFPINEGTIGNALNNDIGFEPARFHDIDIIVNGFDDLINEMENGIYLLEGSYNVGELHLELKHVSRSILYIYGTHRTNGFNMEYGQAYAQNVRRQAILAPNEQ